MSFFDRLIGRRLATWEADEQRIGVLAGVPSLGLDGLSSAAYGPEAALAILIPAGALGLVYITRITAVILILLAILYVSYRQTIAAYPSGGGSYVVAKENLGTYAGLFAAAALILDYVLNVAVGISAGIGAVVSAFPALHDHILALCLGTLVLITIANLRGTRESGLLFAVPTYLFVGSLFVVIAIGLMRAIAAGGHPQPLVAPPALPAAAGGITLWLLVRSFASGCTAMTGVEAVSNGVTAFAEPATKNAQKTLTAIVVILGGLLAGIAYLSNVYHIGAMDQEKPGYQSVLSLLVAAVAGRGVFYYITIGAVLVVLALSANTSFAGFPRLCRIIAEDEYLPHSLANVGRRLVYSIGIVTLAILAGILLIVFGGITDRLIPLFAVGAFGAFTLSQAGMVVHWRRNPERGSNTALAINAVGAVATAIALGVILVAKFVEGAWITVLLIPSAVFLFTRVKHHYRRVERQTITSQPMTVADLEPPVVVIPIKAWTTVTEKAVRFGMRLSPDVIVVNVAFDNEEGKELRREWECCVVEPLRGAGIAPPQLITLVSPYRRLFKPIVDFVDNLRHDRQRLVAVVIPDLVERHWWEHLLHNHRADVLRRLLLTRGNQRVVVISVPWYVE